MIWLNLVKKYLNHYLNLINNFSRKSDIFFDSEFILWLVEIIEIFMVNLPKVIIVNKYHY